MKLKQILLAGVAAGAANMAMATEGTITFSGEIVASTCVAAVNGVGADATVTLPTVSTTDLTDKDQTAGDTHFTINVTECEATFAGLDTNQIKTRFLARNANGSYLANTAASTPAANVAIQLLEDTGVVGSVNVQGADAGSTTKNTPLDFTTGYAESSLQALKTAEIIFPFVARYVATDVSGAGAGLVEAIVDYELAYK